MNRNTIEARYVTVHAADRTEWQPTRIVEIWRVRHGEPREYAERTAPLTINGIRQMIDFEQNHLLPVIEKYVMEGKKVRVKLHSTDVPRTDESKDVVKICLQEDIVAFQWTGVSVFDRGIDPTFKTTDTLTPMMKAGITKRSAFSLWTIMSKKQRKAIGVTSGRVPEDVRTDLRRQNQHVEKFLGFFPKDPLGNEDRHKYNFPITMYIDFGHETGVYAARLDESVSNYYRPVGFGDYNRITFVA